MKTDNQGWTNVARDAEILLLRHQLAVLARAGRLAHHTTGASNGPTEVVNLIVK